eukprot:997800-Rhodomonas_salina.2
MADSAGTKQLQKETQLRNCGENSESLLGAICAGSYVRRGYDRRRAEEVDRRGAYGACYA